MSLRNAKTRLICFRMTQNEYERLQAIRNARGARSLSGFVRGSMSWIIENFSTDPHTMPSGTPQWTDSSVGALTGLVLMLCRKTDSLDHEVKELMTRLNPAGGLGCPESKPRTQPSGPETNQEPDA